jgi:hypothetical protein
MPSSVLKPPEKFTQIAQRQNAICIFYAALEQLLAPQQEDLGKFVKILKHFARSKIKFINSI